ncbi:hypothetical protein C1H76_0815 [Elsinoe australis]|uniref:Uncharacterized protein n=1 Tax=Elsinoe australis TaxID=40998 RepID=A0A4U7BBA3_9PEZI|nr:hypothetical protein C1H76_0815 [Elsinoe australis]
MAFSNGYNNVFEHGVTTQSRRDQLLRDPAVVAGPDGHLYRQNEVTKLYEKIEIGGTLEPASYTQRGIPDVFMGAQSPLNPYNAYAGYQDTSAAYDMTRAESLEVDNNEFHDACESFDEIPRHDFVSINTQTEVETGKEKMSDEGGEPVNEDWLPEATDIDMRDPSLTGWGHGEGESVSDDVSTPCQSRQSSLNVGASDSDQEEDESDSDQVEDESDDEDVQPKKKIKAEFEKGRATPPEAMDSIEAGMTPTQREHKFLHDRASSVRPRGDLPLGRFYIGVLREEIKPSGIRKLSDLLWIKGHRLTTFDTVWHTFKNSATPTDGIQLEIQGRTPDKGDVMEELDFWNDQQIVFRCIARIDID